MPMRLVRLVVPLETDNLIVDLNVSQWPACAALFGLGVIAYRRGCSRRCPTGCAGNAGQQR